MISIIVLTYNSEESIARTLESIRALTDDIHVVDSFSTDGTIAICEKYGCSTCQRPFKSYTDQRNWAIETLPTKYDWQLHLDADEEVTSELAVKMSQLDLASTSADGFIIGRKVVIFGHTLKFGGIARTWHCRLFRRGHGRCEDRLYDQHFLCSGRVERINAFMLDHQENSLTEWTSRHNRWSDLEAVAAAASANNAAGDESKLVQPKISGHIIERKRYAKSLYYRFPRFARAWLYFLYRYIVLLGFLDGYPGLIYHVLQGLWFRFLVDAKIYEYEHKSPLTRKD